ncbi:GTPase HflX [Bacillus cereus Rock4-18]|nr:GTPase HflX [Bacillus cereus Rock4-18]
MIAPIYALPFTMPRDTYGGINFIRWNELFEREGIYLE